jgi:hypothetical protein
MDRAIAGPATVVVVAALAVVVTSTRLIAVVDASDVSVVVDPSASDVEHAAAKITIAAARGATRRRIPDLSSTTPTTYPSPPQEDPHPILSPA